jgi:hypothetical protein
MRAEVQKISSFPFGLGAPSKMPRLLEERDFVAVTRQRIRRRKARKSITNDYIRVHAAQPPQLRRFNPGSCDKQ